MFPAFLRALPFPATFSRARLLILGFVIFGLIYLYPRSPDVHSLWARPPPYHPIDTLIDFAQDEWDTLLTNEAHDVASAATRYRTRRGRHPPPGFAEWFEFAKSKNALLIENLFDQIYHDLSPYWGIEPRELRRQAQSFVDRIIVRNHTTSRTDGDPPWIGEWQELVSSIQEFLPDLDMPINMMDESRLVVPWEQINQYIQKEQSSRHLLEAPQVVSEYVTLSPTDLQQAPPFDPGFIHGNYWELARVGCSPGSPSRQSNMPEMNFTNPPPELNNFKHMSYQGYVQNFTLNKDICIRPELQALHGTFIEPVSISTSHNLFPLFGGSKISVNNEILIPPAMYWADDERYSGGDAEHGGPWEQKHNQLIWRGAATGGRAKAHTWKGFQRHRFLSMVNATAVQGAEDNGGPAINFQLPNQTEYGLNSTQTFLSQFVGQYADVGFGHLVCDPYVFENPYCPYLDPYFNVTPGMPMKEMYGYKYLPDLDGNSFSGRYRGFLRSTSLPIKATIYNEWHDSRLIPWVHFVPMDTTYMDIYGIMAYFLQGRDAKARKIALDGKNWAEKVLRKEDMQVYVYRLLLEYARICDDRRETLGYADGF
ncbi:Lipopolysaccharide-modifying protein [Penicillium alfredii]|uniref:Lipopolysaccharide-modifying protein n=1 Tax=Penicillium alfredii TaxID=1506179 RepID=A0A9W9EM22_9EURO|nr:Lipopolysaccharide-modifying protein [Penicillium alfredii]KAJ5084215.1 Lipopolysaccharide-modifying protein [Penicillium alfredii]